jgi:hypothetical protein
METTMTLQEALKRSGIEADANQWGDCTGTTKGGRKFRMFSCGGAWGEFTLEIEGMNRTAHCLYRTAVKKIKAN